MKDLSQYPIFVVGTSRSGTELISKQILGRHRQVKIARETHYFDDLRLKMSGREKTSLSEEESKICEDYFLALSHKNYKNGGDPEKGWMKRKDLKHLANEIGQGSDSYFEAFCRLFAKQTDLNKTRWGEKTPRHVFRINEIISSCPNAKVVFMLRHPAGVIASYRNFWKRDTHSNEERNRIKQSYSLLIASLLWKAAFKAALKARQQFGENRIYIQKYEDLIERPESSIKALSKWLDLDFQPMMLEKIAFNNNSSYETGTSPDDANIKIGFNKQAAYRWREQLSQGEIAAVHSCCGKLIEKGGYQRESIRFQDLLTILKLWVQLPSTFIRVLLANRDRIGNGNIFNYVLKRM